MAASPVRTDVRAGGTRDVEAGLDALAHLGSGLASEGQCEDAAGLRAVEQQAHDAR